ncbi:flagellar protein FliS [Adlercreutzia sp. ZJ304]|uniref:flagellar protein FliS n=1 Tax=Adlercreutzia sp. ZJ304 TaxID=2709791 RepID=UPI0013EA3280|nr:flagellar protein FliS [Adlercreutzia sp. ZJ304]
MTTPENNFNSSKNSSASSKRAQNARVHTYGMGKGAEISSAPNPKGVSRSAQAQAQPNGKKKKPASFWIAIIVALLCVVLACIVALSMCNTKGERSGDKGQLTNKTQEEIQAELDRTVEEGMFNISVASVVEFEDGTSEGEFRIENVPGNRYLMQVVITLDDTGEEVYRTGIIEPDHHIQKDTLDKDLDPGTYAATAKFLALDPETEEEIGQAAAKISLVVHN